MRMRIAHPAVALLVFGLSLTIAQTGCSQSTSGKEQATSSSPTSQAAPDVRALTQFSNDGRTFIDDVQQARLAIFNGDVKTAQELMAKAKVAIDSAKKDAPTFNIKTTTSVKGKVVGVEEGINTATLIPVNGDVQVSDDYLHAPEKRAHISKANEHLKKSETKEALDELRLAGIDVNFTRTWIPIAVSEKHLDEAIQQADDGKYYEANLALKAIQDGFTFDSMSLADPELSKK